MGDYDDFDLDRTTMRAWSRFQGELADRIVAMEDDDVTIIGVESSLDDEAEGTAPYVQFCAWGEDLVRGEVSSNEYLHADVALDGVGEQRLCELGWLEPTQEADDEPNDEPDAGSANFYLDLERREGDRLAAMAVAALREVFAVPHPAFLHWPDPVESAEGCGEEGAASDAPSAQEMVDRDDEPLAVMPRSAEHLRVLVADALTSPGGPGIEFDDDGDIPLPMGSALLFVRVAEAAPVVELFAFVVSGVLDADRAAFEVAVLNRDTRMIKFVLTGDAVLATLHVPAAPFAPRQLRSMVLAMADVVDRVDDDLVARIGGRRGLEPDDEQTVTDRAPHPTAEGEAPSTHPALLTLMHLDPDGDADLDPELAASVCDFDRDLVLRLLTEASEQEIEWRKSGDRALIAEDAVEAEVCFGEAHAWKATVETLRRALRWIVERQRSEAAAHGERAQDSRRRSAPRRRRGRSVQQSLIDDMTLQRDASGQDALFDPQSGQSDENPEVS